MAHIIKLSDFSKGKFPISTNQYTSIDLQDYIDRLEIDYLEDLLGVDLAADFITWIVAGTLPANAPFTNIYNRLSFEYAHHENCNFRSQGIVEMLKGFIWCEYTKDQPVKNTIAGNVKQDIEVAQVVSNWDAQYQERYNVSIVSYRTIQLYTCLNPEGFEKFNGQPKEILTFF